MVPLHEWCIKLVIWSLFFNLTLPGAQLLSSRQADCNSLPAAWSMMQPAMPAHLMRLKIAVFTMASTASVVMSGCTNSSPPRGIGQTGGAFNGGTIRFRGTMVESRKCASLAESLVMWQSSTGSSATSGLTVSALSRGSNNSSSSQFSESLGRLLSPTVSKKPPGFPLAVNFLLWTAWGVKH